MSRRKVKRVPIPERIEAARSHGYTTGYDRGFNTAKELSAKDAAAEDRENRRLAIAEQLTKSVAQIVDALAHMMPYRQGNGSRP